MGMDTGHVPPIIGEGIYMASSRFPMWGGEELRSRRKSEYIEIKSNLFISEKFEFFQDEKWKHTEKLETRTP